MAWFKVDDGLHASRKVLSIPRSIRLAAIGLWTLAGSWSAHEELDGLVPDYMIAEFGGTARLVDALITSGLWTAVDDGSQFHKWAEYQPTRAELEAARARETERKRRWREGQKNGNDTSVPPGQDTGREPESEHPDPTRPDPTPYDSSTKSHNAAKRGSRVPPNFAITESMRSWANDHVPLVNIDSVLPEWIDYWKGVAGEKGVKLDWEATWHNGMRKQQEWANRDQPASAPSPRRVVSGRVSAASGS